MRLRFLKWTVVGYLLSICRWSIVTRIPHWWAAGLHLLQNVSVKIFVMNELLFLFPLLFWAYIWYVGSYCLCVHWMCIHNVCVIFCVYIECVYIMCICYILGIHWTYTSLFALTVCKRDRLALEVDKLKSLKHWSSPFRDCLPPPHPSTRRCMSRCSIYSLSIVRSRFRKTANYISPPLPPPLLPM